MTRINCLENPRQPARDYAATGALHDTWTFIMVTGRKRERAVTGPTDRAVLNRQPVSPASLENRSGKVL
jgi:hypothetical protein